MPILAQIENDAVAATWVAGHTNVTAMQDQPVMRVVFEFVGHELQQFLLHFDDVPAGCDAGAIGDAEDMYQLR